MFFYHDANLRHRSTCLLRAPVPAAVLPALTRAAARVVRAVQVPHRVRIAARVLQVPAAAVPVRAVPRQARAAAPA